MAICIYRLLEWTHSCTTATPTTSRPQSLIAMTCPCTPACEACWAILPEQASPTGYEPNEQCEDLTSHNFASIQSDSGMSSISSSSTCSVTEIAATTIPGTVSCDQAPRDRLRQQGHGHRLCPREGWSSTEQQIDRNIRRHSKHTRHEALHQQRGLHEEQWWQHQREMLKEISVLKHQHLYLSPLRCSMPSYQRWNMTLLPKRTSFTESRWRSDQRNFYIQEAGEEI